MNDDQRRIAFEILYAEHAAPVYRFALRLCGNPDDAEDLAAEALAKAFRQLDGYRGDASQRTWLFSIVLNQWRMLKRKAKGTHDRLDSAEHIAGTFRFNDLDLAAAIFELPEPLREAFLLVKGEGLSHAEAAKIIRVPAGTMSFRVHSAIKQLRQKLEPHSPIFDSTSEVICSHEM